MWVERRFNQFVIQIFPRKVNEPRMLLEFKRSFRAKSTRFIALDHLYIKIHSGKIRDKKLTLFIKSVASIDQPSGIWLRLIFTYFAMMLSRISARDLP